MNYGQMQMEWGEPIQGARRERTRAFLQAQGLRLEPGLEVTVNLVDERIGVVATASLDGDTIKCMAVSPAMQGEGLAARVVSEVIRKAVQRGHTHLFAFTKPTNRAVFGGLGFYPIAETAEAVLLENRRDGVGRFVRAQAGETHGVVGAVVANSNPFTNGHLYLMETAAARCDSLYVFVLSEDRSEFPAADRLELVREGTAHLSNLLVRPTGRYLVSSLTFPSYFIKEREAAQSIGAALDVAVFGEHFAPALGISLRFVGTEPYSPVTDAYNRLMRERLPGYGVELVELPRCTVGDEAVSASRVRRLLAGGQPDQAERLVPPATRAYLHSEPGQAVVRRLQETYHESH